MKKKILLLALILCLLIVPVLGADLNFINPGLEYGNITGWHHDNWQDVNLYNSGCYSGSYCGRNIHNNSMAGDREFKIGPSVSSTVYTGMHYGIFYKMTRLSGGTWIPSSTSKISMAGNNTAIGSLLLIDGNWHNIDLIWSGANNTAAQTLNFDVINGGGTGDVEILVDEFYPSTYSTPPTTERTVTFTVKNLANQPLNGIYTDIFVNIDHSDYQQAITGADGNVTYTLSVPSNSSVHFGTSATGLYSAYNEDFNLDTTPLSKTVYLQPVSPSGTFANFTYNIVDTNLNPIINAYIEHLISPNYELIDLTDSNGQKTFYNVPVVNNAWYYTAYKAGYIDYSRWSSFSAPFPSDVVINITLQGGGITPTPTPIGYTPTPTPIITPPVGLEWSLSANPNSILLGDSSMLWLSAPNSIEDAKAKSILYYENNNLGSYSTFILKGTYKYNTTSSQWDFKNPVTNQWTYGGQDKSILTVYPATTGTYTYKATIFDNGTWPYTTGNIIGTAQTTLVIGGGAGGDENLVCLIAATDGSTSSHLTDWSLTLTDTITGASNHWDNITYDKTVSLVRGRDYSITGDKSGYISNTRTITPPLDQNVQAGDIGAMFNIPLFKSSDISAGNTTVIVAVLDKDTYVPVPNAKVSITGQTWKFTGEQGESASFILPQNTDYTATTEKDGYCGSSTFGNTGTDDYQNVFLYLKYGACLNPTPTHTPIPNSTGSITPTITPLHYANLSTPTACNRNITFLSPNYTFVEQGLNQVACAGFTDNNQQKLVLAILVILLFGGIFGYIAGGTGILAGIGIGVVIDTAAGLLDAWIFFAFLIIAAVLISMKLFGGGFTG